MHSIQGIKALRRTLLTCVVVLSTIIVAFVATNTAVAQTGTAALAGTVTDSQDAAITGATVVITNVATGISQSTATNSVGQFNLAGLMPSTYSLRVDHSGFESFVVSALDLHTGDQKEIAVRLKPGKTTVTVTVSADDENVLNTETSVSNVVTAEEIENQPLNGRSFQDLILLSPGTTTNSPQSPSGMVGGTSGLSVNGQSGFSNNFTVDGVSGNTNSPNNAGYTSQAVAGSTPSGTALGTTQSLVSVDALQEFRSETSTFAAEYGRTPGGQFSLTTKSGGDTFHGTAFDYLRNSYFDANDFFNDFNGVSKPALRQNDFGGTLGGYVTIPRLYNGHHRTFFFFNYEGLRLEQPSEAYRAYVMQSTVVATAKSAPGKLGSVLAALPQQRSACNASGTPSPTYTVCYNDGTASYINAYAQPSDIDNYSIRIDQVLNSKNVLFGRYSNTTSDGSEHYTGNISANQMFANTLTLGLTSTFTAHMVNEFRGNYSINTSHQLGYNANESNSTPTDFLADEGYPDSLSAYDLNWTYSATNSVSEEGYKSTNAGRQLNFVDSLTYQFRKHALKFGVDWRRFSSTDLPESPITGYSEYYLSSVESGAVDYYYAYQYAQSFPLFQNFSLYAQDSFRATNRMTIDYGVRWDINPAPTSRRGPLEYNLIGWKGNINPVSGVADYSQLALAPEGTPPYNTYWKGIAPRFGISYMLRNNTGWETLIRGGAGIYYDAGGNDTDTLSGYTGAGFGSSYTAYGAVWGGSNLIMPLTSQSALYPPYTNPPVAPYNSYIYGIDPDLQLPYAAQVNITLQQGMGAKSTLAVSYVGTYGERGIQWRNYDTAVPCSVVGCSGTYNGPTVSGKPEFPNGINLMSNGYGSNYNALQATYQHKMGHGLYAWAGYTYSKAIADGSVVNAYEVPSRTVTGGDVRQNFNAVVSYDVPGHFNNLISKSALEHWGIDVRQNARTGFPFAPNAQATSVAFTTKANQKVPLHYSAAYLNGTVPLYYNSGYSNPHIAGANEPTKELDPWAFTPTTITMLEDGEFTAAGAIPFNAFRGFGAVQTNLAIRRDFPIYHEMHLQFRAESFNIFNHPQFGGLDGYDQTPWLADWGNSLTTAAAAPDYNSQQNANFGVPGSTLANSLGASGAQYNGGGPRSTQFALKFIF